MLRRKLLLFLGPLVLLLLLTAMTLVWLLQGVLQDMRHIKDSAWVLVEDINRLSVTTNAVEVHLFELQTNRSRRLDSLIDDVEESRQLIDILEDSELMQDPAYARPFRRIKARFPEFARHVSALATAQDGQLAREHNEEALRAIVAIRQDTLPLGHEIYRHAQTEQEDLLGWFRWMVLGVGLVFLLVINIAVIVLLRMSTIILSPIDKLVEATRELAAGRYDHRVNLVQKDEFDQLAQAYNQLAQQLQSDEKRRLEMLGQVSLTMNHEINNAVAIIEMQLRLMSRQQGPTAATEKCLREIHDSLDRMTRTVQALKNVRQIVLTDYVGGVKMLDLEKSVQPQTPQPEPRTLAANHS